MKEVFTTSQYRKDVKRYRHDIKKMRELYEVINKLRNGEMLPLNYRAHFLHGEYEGCLECHIQGDFLLVWVESEHILLHKKRNSDLLAQADAIVRQTDGRRLGIEMEETDEGLHRAKAVLSDGTVLCEAESKSWRYARTKVTKMVLNLLATPFRKELLSDPDYHARVLAREEEKAAKRKAEVEARDAAREALRLEKLEKRKEQARIRDAKRRQSQAEAKKRKAENAARAAAKAAKDARPMSAKKRRFLEDKKK